MDKDESVPQCVEKPEKGLEPALYDATTELEKALPKDMLQLLSTLAQSLFPAESKKS